MIKALNITSDIRPAGGGLLPCRISLHRSEGFHPIATHMEALQETGNWARMQGNYFAAEHLPEALADYRERCAQLGVDPFPQED